MGLRGLVYYELLVEGASHDLHSGVYGGAAPNPMQAIAEIICALKDRDGHIQIPGFYDRVVPPAEKERAAWASLPFDESEYTENEMGARAGGRARGSALRARLGAAHRGSSRHSRRLHRRRRQDRDPGARPAKISMRLVADQRCDEPGAVQRRGPGRLPEASRPNSRC